MEQFLSEENLGVCLIYKWRLENKKLRKSLNIKFKEKKN